MSTISMWRPGISCDVEIQFDGGMDRDRCMLWRQVVANACVVRELPQDQQETIFLDVIPRKRI